MDLSALKSFADGAGRIWANDRFAILVVGLLALFQAFVFVWVRKRTSNLLKAARDEIVSASNKSALAQRPTWKNQRLRDGWALVFPDGERALADSPELSDVLAATNLLPPDYNPRLDAAAPGLFTALGIVGTFLGLILGFVRVDPSSAETSIGPLLGGMVVAFLNSLLGVSLSLWWTVRSRHHRHEFDVACDNLRRSATSHVTRLGPAELLIREMRRIAEYQFQTNANLSQVDKSVVQLQASTDKSSAQLLENLSSHLGDSMRSLVNAPFDQLTNTVRRFDSIAQQVTERQEEVNRRMDAASETLSQAGKSLSDAVTLTRQCVDEFSVASLQMKDGANQVERIVESVRTAANGIGWVVESVSETAGRLESAKTGLESGADALKAGATALDTNADRYREATEHLERAIATLERATDSTVEQSVTAVRNELQAAMASLVGGIEEAGAKSIAAYEASSERVAKAIDVRMSDLTDRLSAELTTLASRLPAEVESLNNAMAQIRTQIQRATRSMDDAVNQLAHRTPEAMKEQLKLYDHALADAMDHFSGTLSQWDGRIASIDQLSTELRRLSSQVALGSD